MTINELHFCADLAKKVPPKIRTIENVYQSYVIQNLKLHVPIGLIDL